MRIGIFGGSFNPPHNMHKNIALDLIENNYLDKVIYVPTGDNYKKIDLINFIDRYKMVELMIKEYKFLSISNIGNNTDYQYTYQTLDYFKKINKNDEIYFICGSDNLNEFNTWKNYEYVLKKYKILVITRNDNINNILSKYEKFKNNIIIINIKRNIISSTSIRELIKKSKYDTIIEHIDKKVLQYIKNNNLYGGTDERNS